MRKVNLLVPIPSIRNTLTPDGSYQKSGSDRRPKAVIVFLLIVTAMAYAAVFQFNAPGADVAVMNVPAPAVALKPEPKSKEPPAAGDVKPDEIKKVETAFDPLLTRPVAQDATPTPKPKSAQARPASGKWAIRFGLCVYKPNCDRMVEDLSRKRIESFITEGAAEVTFYKVMVGPFPTQTHAEAAAGKFRAKKMELSPFAVDDQHYLGAASFIDPKTQNEIIGTAKSLGYRAEGASAKEIRKVYKVYRSLMFDTKQAAEKGMRFHKEKGLDCIIEKQD